MPSVALTHGYFMQDDPKEQLIRKPYPPLGILYIASWLEKHAVNADVFDTTFEGRENWEEFFTAKQYDIVGIYTNLVTKPVVIRMISFLKKKSPRTLIVVGGPDITYNVTNYLASGADICATGEGEQTFLEIVQAYPQRRPEIPGTSWLDEKGALVQNPAREKIKELDVLSFPSRKKIPMEKYLNTWKSAHGYSSISMSTQRGCPYTCKWCSTAVYGQSYRRRSPAHVCDEIGELQQHYAFDAVWFVDDVFTVSHKWLSDFAKELRERNMQIRYECITRADRLNPEVVRMLKDSGCFRLWIGAESGSQKVIDLMDRRVSVQQVRDMIQLARREGIEAGTFIMLGYPGEELADIHETVRHLRESHPDHFTITVAYPIKGTALYTEVEEYISTGPDWTMKTDRDNDFPRKYSRKFYDYAVRYVVNKVMIDYDKTGSGKWSLNVMKRRIKASLAYSGMRWKMLTG